MKLQIEHVAGTAAGQSVSFVVGTPDGKPRLRLGRGPDNDVVFDPTGDIAASTYHAEVVLHGSHVVLRDLGSSNGTRVNGVTVREHILKAGDVVEFGRGGPKLRFTFEASTVPSAAARSAVSPTATTVDPAQPLSASSTVVEDPAVSAPRGTVPRTPPAPRGPVPPTVSPSSGMPAPATVPAPAPVAAVPPPGAADDGKVGKRTVLRMIAEDRKRSRGLLWAVVAAFTLVIVGGGVTAVLLWPKPKPSTAVIGQRIVQNVRDSIFMLAWIDYKGATEGFCSAFAVGPQVLGTNAHCIEGWLELKAKHARVTRVPLRFIAIQNGRPQAPYDVVRYIKHPEYNPKAEGRTQLTADVGLLVVSRPLPQTARVALGEELTEVGAGSTIYNYGFPGRFMRPEAPEATFTEGRVGRVTTLGFAVSDWRQNRLIQHSALTTGGTSGSPLIDHEGRIVGINAGASGSAKRDLVIDERTGRALPVKIVGETGYKYAMRIDLLTDLMAQNGLPLPGPPARR
jgi:pSer/pThr/pTyr-binding forkhead associated (FHA) protein